MPTEEETLPYRLRHQQRDQTGTGDYVLFNTVQSDEIDIRSELNRHRTVRWFDHVSGSLLAAGERAKAAVPGASAERKSEAVKLIQN